jgi:hypothetical protein
MSTPVSDVWDFKRDGDHRWSWTRESLRHEPLKTSRTAFTTLDECIADARRHGYTGTFSAGDEPKRDSSGRLLRLRRR